MPTYKVWHGECDSYKDAEVVEASNPKAAAKDCLFRYYAGDCDSGATAIEPDTANRFIATREDSPDYFYVEEQVV